MSLFLRLRPWQLFILVVGLPMLVQLLTMLALVLTRHWAAVAIGMPLSMLALSLFLGWLWALGTRLAARRPVAEAAGGLRWFRAGLRLAFGYMLVFLALMTLMLIGATRQQLYFTPVWLLLLLPLHLLSIASLFYAQYFVARTLKAVELRRPAELSEYIGDFFLLWFFPVGLWFIQPRVRRLVAAEDGVTEPAAG